MANKKISELVSIQNLFESQSVLIPIVVDYTTYKIDSEDFSRYINRDNPTTGSNIFIGNQTITGSLNVTGQSRFGGNLIVDGRITAQEFFSEYVSSSIIYESGSTKFGDTLDDTHQITGSLFVTGALFTNGLDIYNSTRLLNSITSSLFTATQSAISRLNSIETYTSSLKTAFSVSGNTILGYNAIFTGSVNITGSLTTIGDIYPNGIRVGRGAGDSLTNTVIGYNAGNSNSTGVGNIFIGNSANTSNGTYSNQIVIGSGSIGIGNNTTVIGNASTTKTYIPGNLLLGSSTSSLYSRTLQVVGDTNTTRLLIDSASNSNITYPFSLQTNRPSDISAYIENLSDGYGLLMKNWSNSTNYALDVRAGTSGNTSRFTVLSNGRVLIGAQDNALHRLIVTGSVYADFLNGIQTQTFVTTDQVISEGVIGWDDGNGTLALGLKGGNVTLQIGQEQVVRVFNEDTVPLTDGMIVYITGAQGNRISVKRASAIAELGSASTLGMVTEPIAIGAEGFITTQGVVNGLNTIGLSEGALLFLSETPGQYTPTRPIAPSHTVVVGFVQRVHASVGSIFVKIDNGYEIDELHNVVINTGSQSYGDLLMRSGSVWTNTKELSGSYVITGSLRASSFTGSLFGTASYATNALTASYSLNAQNSFIQNGNSFGTTATLGTNDNNALAFETSGSTRLYISSSGAIGIGTTTPQTRFDVIGNTRITGSLILTGSLISTADSYINNTRIGTGPGVGANNILFGSGSLLSNFSGYSNLIIGNNIAKNLTSGNDNIVIGLNALRDSAFISNTNIIIGNNALSSALNNYSNVIIGDTALNASKESYTNTAIGVASLAYLESGSGNVAIGGYAGNFYGGAYDTNTFSNTSVFIGLESRPLGPLQENQIVIGAYAIGNGSNTATIGGTTTTKTILYGNVGIGTTNPAYSLDVVGDIKSSANLIGSASFLTLTNRPTLVSGSSQITISSTTGYTTFSSSLSGRISYFETRLTGSSATFNSGLQTIISIPTGSNTSVFFNYTLLSGSNTRAGQFMTVWSGNQIQFTDVSTLDIGDTTNVILTSSLSGTNVILTTALPSNGWIIKTMANLL